MINFFLFVYLLFFLCNILVYAQYLTINRAPFASSLEREVFRELNLARQNPGKYASFLKRLKPYYVGKFIKRPGQPTVMTEEGVSAADEAIHFLRSVKPLAPLRYSSGLSRAAMDHVRDQGQKGMLGHRGSDGSQPGDRVNRYGTWRWTVGENISYGRERARDIVVGLIIDDGVPGRGHRDNVFNSSYRFAGVACGDHKTFGMMCVITFAGEFVEKGRSKL
ncbi:MAG: CAP domain-containing protein [bacterium]|nr:MAG: CAP domain-containing protein [bacterium]